MDQKRLLLAISISLAILVVFQVGIDRFLPHPPPRPAISAPAGAPAAGGGTPAPQTAPGTNAAPGQAVAAPAPAAPLQAAPKLTIDAPAVAGSISLVGAKFDNLTLRYYHETISKTSPQVQLLSDGTGQKPYFVQFGWSAAPGQNIAVPGPATLWTASAGTLTQDHPVTLSWNNGAGLVFQQIISIDDKYMFTIRQAVVNNTGAAVTLFPWSRIERDYLPPEPGTYIMHKGPLGVFKGTLKELNYETVKNDGKRAGGTAYTETSDGGWIGITGKYWLTALIPSQTASFTAAARYIASPSAPDDGAYQVDFVAATPQSIAAGATGESQTHLFAGAKIVKLLDSYSTQYNIPSFDKAIDFGWFYFLTKPIFFALDGLNNILGNFGLAIIAFTFFAKLVLSPLAFISYSSMGKMKLVTPKVTAIRERLKDDPTKQQAEIMALYKAEKINPAAGCLPMLVQIPIFFSLYKVIFVTIEMRHAPFYGWIHDLSAIDPTNLFNLFGLIPFDPSTISPFLHLGILPIIMGGTMYLQQRLNPAPPDPVQAKMFQFMPLIFTFMLARFPAGLVIYWTTNNILTVIQQWLIMRWASKRSLQMART
jgi:YidC/Oxa1 family membrane protein insertase